MSAPAICQRDIDRLLVLQRELVDAHAAEASAKAEQKRIIDELGRYGSSLCLSVDEPRYVYASGQTYRLALGFPTKSAPYTAVVTVIQVEGQPSVNLYEMTWERSESIDWRGTVDEFLAEYKDVPADFVEQLRALPVGGSLYFEGGSAEWTMRRVA